MKILVTGFEPYGESVVNPSAIIVDRLTVAPPENLTLQTAVLPVDRHAGPDKLIRAVIGGQPDWVLCLGEAGGRTAVCLERVAINLLDFDIPDNGGHQAVDEAINHAGPAAYFTSLPVRRMVVGLQEADIPAQLSLSAGTFLCNQVMYELLHYLHKHPLPTRGGFVHLPQLPEQVAAAGQPRPSMSLALQETAVRLLLSILSEMS